MFEVNHEKCKRGENKEGSLLEGVKTPAEWATRLQRSNVPPGSRVWQIVGGTAEYLERFDYRNEMLDYSDDMQLL